MKYLILFLISSLFIVLGCVPQELPPQMESVSVQLKWVHQAQFAGFYVAQEDGLYAEENLDVTFVQGGIGIDIFEGVVNDEIDYAVVSADQVIKHVHNNESIIALATTYRINPFILVAFQDSEIRSPQDFVGKTLSISQGGYDEIQVLMMLKKAGLDISDVTITSYDENSVQDFIDGKIDVINSFAAGGLFTLQDAIGERPITILWPGDYDVNFYSDTIITNTQTAENNKDVTERFLRATLKGHRIAVENPDLAVDSTMKYAVVQDRAVQSRMLDASIPLIHTGKDPIGVMESRVWEEMQQSLVEFGAFDESMDFNRFFTLEFLEKIYKDA